MRLLLRVFFHFLYHQFAFAYDLVAAIVSFGNWKNWVMEVVPFIEGMRTLEIGHGPGHLHRFLLQRGLVAVAIDRSAPMGRLAKRRLMVQPFQSPTKEHTPANGHSDYTQINLIRGLAQQLPFRPGAFQTVVATFPAEYITDPRTVSEVRRCLSDGGRFVVLPAAMPKNRLLSWLFQVTGQAQSEARDVILEKWRKLFAEANFNMDAHVLELDSGILIVLVATKTTVIEEKIYVKETS